MTRTIITRLLLLVTAAVCSRDALADEAHSKARLVSFDDLQARLGEPKLRLLDARPRAAYDKGHLPGALWVDAKAVEAMAARPGALNNRKAWEAWIQPLGIGPHTEVLIYDANRQLDAARLWWLLSYLGVERVGLVDGSYPLWAEQGRPTDTGAPTVEPVPFPVSFQAGRRAARPEVLAALASRSARIVDARTLAEYNGEDKRSKRSGHMPAACHLEWNNLVGKDGRFLPEAELRARIEKAGLRPGEATITHCQGGGRASVNAFVLERLGYPTRNYYESWADWGNAEETPIEISPKK
jgi:thiosulfate/3-mercaptopyruvate sulfurtransferase